jgi:hypothetical protein
MTLSTAVLRPGDWVHYDGSEHQVAGAGRNVGAATDCPMAPSQCAGRSPHGLTRLRRVDSEPAPSVEACLGALDRELLAVGELH